MKILHTADWHLGIKVPSLEISRLEEQAKILEEIKNIIQNEKIDVILIAGDIFEVALPSVEAERVFFKFISDVAGDLKKYILIISGNHDSSEKIANLNVFSKVFNNRLKLFTDIKPDFVNHINEHIFTIDDVSFIGIPFIPRYAYSGEYQKIFESILLKLLEKSTDTTVLFSHDTVKEAEFSGTEVMYDDKTLDYNSISLISEFNKVIYWALGHIHKQQKVTEKIYYSGSIIQTNFGERDQNKSVIVCEVKDKGTLPNITPIQIKQEVILKQYEISNSDDVEKIIEQHKTLDKESYTKIVIKTQIETSSIHKLKSEIKNSIIVQDIPTKDNSNIEIEEIKKIVNNPINMFKNYCEFNKINLSNEEIEYLSKIYDEILNSNKETI